MNKAWILLTLLVLAPATSAQRGDPWLDLGVDATQDARWNGIPMLDTWIDINGMAVTTIAQDLVFYLGIEGTTTEAGQYCWMAAFEFKAKEYVGLDCYEGFAYQSDNTLSGISPPSTSRGTNVASSVVFEGGAAKITIPLSAIGAQYGDEIADIYGLTYITRALSTVDTIPDAKSSVNAAESLGTYIIGGPEIMLEEPEIPEPQVFYSEVPETFGVAVTEATDDLYLFNWTTEFTDFDLAMLGNVSAGSVNLTVTDPSNNITYSEILAQDFNVTLQLLEQTPGTWQFKLQMMDFVGAFNATMHQLVISEDGSPVPVSPADPSNPGTDPAGPGANNGNSTGNQTLDDKESPGLALAPALVVVAAIGYLRSRRS